MTVEQAENMKIESLSADEPITGLLVTSTGVAIMHRGRGLAVKDMTAQEMAATADQLLIAAIGRADIEDEIASQASRELSECLGNG